MGAGNIDISVYGTISIAKALLILSAYSCIGIYFLNISPIKSGAQSLKKMRINEKIGTKGAASKKNFAAAPS